MRYNKNRDEDYYSNDYPIGHRVGVLLGAGGIILIIVGIIKAIEWVF